MDVQSYILSKKYVEDSLVGAGALKGKSAYEIAVENGFKGTANEWLASLKGSTPQIGPKGTWVIDDFDTGVIASPSLAGYATEEFVNQQIANIEFPETDLSAYATRAELNAAILGIIIPDVSGFATKEELEQAILSIPAPDLTPYATKEEVRQAIANIPEVDLDGYATEQFVNEAISNIPQPDLEGYVTDAELAVALAGIEIPSTDGLASEEYVEERIAEIAIPDVTGLATEAYVDEAIANIEHPTVDLTGLATEEFVAQKIAEAELAEGDVDLSAYYTKSEVDEKLANLDVDVEMPDLSNFATKDEIPNVDGLASEEFVAAAIAAIQHPSVDLSSLATEEYVQEQINSIEHPSVDLTGLATEEFVESKIAEIEFPTTDLEGYATEEFVANAIAAIPEVDLTNYATKDELPSVAGLASEEYVDTAVANLVNSAPTTLDTIGEIAKALQDHQEVADALNEAIGTKANKSDIPSVEGLASETYVDEAIAAIPEVDLSNYATKEELPSVAGLASEEFVTEAIAAIEIPEAKADVKVYEISSDSAVLDELVTLLPEGIEINQGDVMVVTNTLGVKSAYQYDEGWIACDGNVDASRVIMPFDITLAGSYTQVGNLSKTSTGTATFATRGKSVATALQEMLSKREQPSIKTQPKVTLTATSGAKEVGTEVTPTWSASLGAGEYTYGPATGVVAKTWAISDTDGHSASTASGSFAKFTVGDDTNYRITAKATYDEGAIAKDNLGDPSDPVVRIAAGSKTANGSYVTGYRAWFMYVGESLDTIDSAFIRGTTNKGATPSTQSGVTIPAGTKRVMVAIPANGSNLTSVIDVDGMGLDVFGNFTKMNVDVEGLNGYQATSYDVWVAENENGLAATHYNLVIG